MKWQIRLETKRKRKQAFRLRANSIQELVSKLAKHAGKFHDFHIETAINDPVYWKSQILALLFQETHSDQPLLA
jgi:hypothetical protein